jgi:clan AA aspartic protease (TIGR02281 family)
MAIEVRCPHCEAGIRAGDKYAGQQVKCPKCGGQMQVPPLAAPSPAPKPEPSVAASSPAVAASTAGPIANAAPPATPTAPAPAAAVAVEDAGPIVRVDDEPWRKAVSKKRGTPSSSRGASGWMLPAFAIGGLAGVLAIGAFFWMQQKGQPADGTNIVASKESDSDSSGDDEPAVRDDTTPVNSASKNDEVPVASSDSSSTDSKPPAEAKSDATPVGNSGETLAAMTPAEAAIRSEKAMASEDSDQPAEDKAVARDDAAKSSDASQPSEKSPAATAAADAAPVVLKGPPEDVLKEHGIKVSGDQASLIDEQAAALRASLGDAKKLRLSLTRAYAETAKLERFQKELKTEHGARSAALAEVASSGNVAANNTLVGQLNAIKAKLDQIDDQLESSRNKLAESREAYIEHLLKARGIIKDVEKKYEEASADPQVKAALAKLSKDSGNEVALAPLGSFYRAEKDLAKLEEQILSDTIVARVQSGNLLVSTMIDGEHPLEMMVDSGASVVTLPYAAAVAAGLKPKDTDPVAEFQIANGSIIKGQMITIPSLRVGKFTVENVEAAVLGPEAVNAMPLLGMSFLEKFEVKIDSERGNLVLSRIEGTEGSDKIR